MVYFQVPVAFAAGNFISSRMIKGLAHLCIFANNLERSLDFYCGTLGLKRHFDFHKNGQLYGFYLEVAPVQFVEIFQADSATNIKRQRIHHFCLEVADIDALCRRLTERGVSFRPKKLGCDQTWQCWCQDPDGLDIEFQQYTPQSSQYTRANCIVNW